MPNFIKLLDKTSNEPENFSTIDEKLCKALGVSCDNNRYYCEWYVYVGYSGVNELKELIERIQRIDPDAKLLTALKWLDQHYSLNAWYSR